jgi:hypothetical protein
MKRPSNIYYRLVGLVLFVVLATGCGKRTAAQDAGGMDEETRAKLELMQQMMMIENFGDILISGQITDENGEQLNGVKVTGYYQWMTEETGGTTEIDTMFDGVFEFNFTNCGVVELKFEKDGYYKAELDRSASDGEPDWGGRKKLEDRDLAVVMEKQGQLVDLAQLRMSLEFDVSGKASIAEVKTDGTLSKSGADDVRGEIADPEHGIYLTADSTGLAINVIDDTNMYGDVVGLLPLGAKLTMCNSNDGFVRHESGAEVGHETLRRMKTAPDSGYARQLAINPEASTFFYFKTGPLYGKGYIGPVNVKTEKNSCRGMLSLYLQKDGSGNLESIYY